MPERTPPYEVAPAQPSSDIKNDAAIIFIHGFSDDGKAWEQIAHQYQNAKVLPYLHWSFPNAMENRDARDTAWYTPTHLSRLPPQRPELEEDEDEDGLLFSMKYISGLIDDFVAKGIPASRIVVAGFSQGCAMSLLTGLASKYAGQLAGIAGLMGYMPIPDKINELRKEEGKENAPLKVFLVRGIQDQLVPKRYFSMALETLEKNGVSKQDIWSKEYPIGHQANGEVLRDLAFWLERIIPPLEGTGEEEQE